MPQQDQLAGYNIEDMAHKYGLDPGIIRRQIHQESSGNPDALSPKGAMGLMQLMPHTAERLGVTDPYDPQQNLEGGMQEMGRLVKKYNGDYSKALAAYNAGEERVDKAGGIPQIAETQNYVKSVLGDYHAPIKARTPDGKVHVFPYGTSQDVITKAIRNYLKLPSQQTAEAAEVGTKPLSKGDRRMSEQEVKQNIADTNREIDVFWGKKIPDAAVPALAWGQKYLVDPFEKMSQAGAQVGSEALRIGAMHVGITGPKGQGVVAGVGELVGGTLADPRMWPFMLEGAAKGAISRLAAKGFQMQMIWQAAKSIPEAREAIKAGDDYNAARLITEGIGAGTLAGVSEGAHEYKAPEKSTATHLGPISKTGGQQVQLDFANKAPAEAHAPQVTAENASVSASAPVVDKQSLVGAESPIPRWKFPSDERLATGKTIGLGKVELGRPPADVGLPAEHQAELNAKFGREVPPGEAIELDRLELARRSAQGEGIPQAAPAPKTRAGGPEELAKQAGLIYKDEVMRGSDVHQFEDPKFPGQTMSVKRADLSTPKDLRTRMDAKLAEFKAKPSPGMQPPPAYGATFDTIADLKRQADLAEHEDHANALTERANNLEEGMVADQRTWMQGQSNDLLKGYADLANKRAVQLDTQSKAIRDLTEATIKNRGIKKEIADLRSPGGPVRRIADPETGESIAVKPETPITRGARSVFDELQGRVPTSEFDALKVQGKPEGVSDEEWAQHVGKLQAERQALKKSISDAVTIASDTGSSIAEAGIDEHVARLKEIEGLLGKYIEPATTGRRPQIKAELDEQGAIKAPEPLKSWTVERARLALGQQVNKIPTDEEFFQHADMRSEKARLFKRLADEAQSVVRERGKAGERGAIGEPALKGKVQPVSLKDAVPSDEEVLKRALKAKIYAHAVDDDFPAGRVGLLSRDGKTWLDSGHMAHDDIAESILPELYNPKSPLQGNALRAMLEKGWIRKAAGDSYEAWNLDSRSRDTIEMDQLRSGKHGQELYLDTRNPQGLMKPLVIENGWNYRYNDLEGAINAAKKRHGWTGESGRIGGTTLATTSTIGGLVGGVVGAHLGHPYEGAAIGWGLGFVSPAIAAHPTFWRSLNGVGQGITRLGIGMNDWLKGPKQDPSILPDMAAIRDAQQRDVRGPVRSLVDRVAQLPGNTYVKMFDKFAFLNDRPGAISNFLMKFDERGRAFRDLRGRLDVENSPYVSAWLAAGGGGGMQEAHLLDYKRVIQDGQKSGLLEHLNDYLNLKGYQRVYDVLQERVQEADQAIARLQQGLQTPRLPVEVEAGMRKALREAKAERQEVVDKLASGNVVPAPYGPTKIATDLQALQAHPKFADVKRIADRVFGLNRKVLDMVHDSGIIGDDEYNKYIGRGDEYIPMHRILEQVANYNAATYGTGSPLYLRQQNVIKALSGSDKINRDPIVASADANREAIREVVRNGVIKDFLKLAAADPQGVGQLFKQVRSGYKAAADEGLVGVYKDGQQITFKAPSWLAESLKNVSPSSLDVIGKGPLRYFSQILRKGATMGNLAWSVPNALRHFGDMAIMSDAGLKDIRTLPKDAAGLMRDWIKSVYASITHDPMWQEYMQSGAAYSTLQQAITPEMGLDLKTLGFTQKLARGRIIDTVADFNRAIEDATKMTTYRRLRQAGYTEKAAAWETRRYGGGPDFARQGNMTPAINLASMFFNAHLQYVSRVFARAAENPARVAVALGMITALAMTLNEHNYNQKDEKGNLLMRKVPYTDRENNFVVLTGDTYESSSGAVLPVYYKVPKPSFVKFLYNPIENMLNKVAGHEERSGTQLGLQAVGNLSPGQMDLQEGQIGKSTARGIVSSLNPLIKTPLEEAMNYKTTGVGQPIVPASQQNIQPWRQYGPGTSQVAKDIGQGGVRGAVAGGAEGATIGYLLGGPKGAAVGGGLGSIAGTFGISPRRAEHVIDSTTAGVGRMATGFVDPFLGGVKQTRMEGPEKLANTPIAGPIAARFISTSVDQQEQARMQEFYTNAQAAQEPLKTLQYLEKNSPEQVPSWIQKNKDVLWRGKLAATMQSRLGQVVHAQQMIEQNQNMDPQGKADALKNLHAVKLQLLDVFTKIMRPSPQVGQASAFPGQGQGSPR